MLSHSRSKAARNAQAGTAPRCECAKKRIEERFVLESREDQ